MSWASQLVNDLSTQLNDEEESCTRDLLKCGFQILQQLRSVVQGLLNGDDRQNSIGVLDALTDMAYTRMSSPSEQTSLITGWRRLFTDTCLLRSLADIDILPEVSEATAVACISRLDRAIIISGAAGEGRLDLILSVIERFQSSVTFHRSSKPGYHFSVSVDIPTPLDSSSTPILCLDTAPSLSSFQSHLCTRPFIVRGFACHWPAMQEHPWRSVDYLRSVAGPGRVVPIEIGNDYRRDDWSQKLMSWDEFLDYLYNQAQQSSESPYKQKLYLAQHTLLMQFSSLRADVLVPDYLYATLPPPQDFVGYNPPKNEEQLVINAWLGPAQTISPAHTDPYHNCYTQLAGRKSVWLAPPTMSPFMYPYLNTSTTEGQLTDNNPSMSNTSRVDVFASREETSCQVHPEFWKNVVAHSMSATLEPGDLLYFPPGWWHAMRSEDTSFSISMWF